MVVADTSPLRYLVQIDLQHILPILFETILIPPSVHAELLQGGTPAVVRLWAEQVPSWVEVRRPEQPPDETLAADLDPGERDAIQLALERSPILLLIDERQGAKVAKALNILTTGTLGIIVKAAESGLIEVDEALDRLSQTNFRCTPQLFEHARQLAFRRKSDLNTAKGPAFS